MFKNTNPVFTYLVDKPLFASFIIFINTLPLTRSYNIELQHETTLLHNER